MELISQAERALARNWRTVFVYMALGALCVALYQTVNTRLDIVVPAETTPKPPWYIATELAAEIGLALAISMLQAIAFARLGTDIDRPLWKCASDGEALHRFTGIWLVINLTYFLLGRLAGLFEDSGMESAQGAIISIALIATMVYVPVGICLMHNGGARKLDVAEALQPLLHMFPLVLLVGVIGLFQQFLFELLISSFPTEIGKLPVVIALANLPVIYLECLAVAIMWIVCVRYRAYAAERNDDDLDF